LAGLSCDHRFAFGLGFDSDAFKLRTISSRIALERDPASFRFAQASTSRRNSGERRIAVTGSFPVAGRPRFFRTTFIDVGMFKYYTKNEPGGR
jgi:hypothetical protein